MKHRYSFRDVIDSLPNNKNSRSSIWVRNVIRKISFPMTLLFINAGWSANMVSLFSWLVIFIGSVLLGVNNFWSMLIGILLINFWLVLDCVDGNIARCKKQQAFMGDFYDAIAGYGPFAFSTIGLGLAAYHTSFIVPEQYKILFILLGGIGATVNIYSRLIHQKYLNCYFVAKNMMDENDDITLKSTADKTSFAYIRERVDKELGVAGLYMIWLFIALFTSTFDIMLAFYVTYYLVSFLAVIYIYCRKAAEFEKTAQNKFKYKVAEPPK